MLNIQFDWNSRMMFPPSVKDFVPQGHLAHFVRDTVVEALDRILPVEDAEIAARRELLATNAHPSLDEWRNVTPQATLNLLASFQATVIEELLKRAARSAEEIDARTLIISGGVACNSGLRIAAESSRLPIPVLFPTRGLSTDNAAMIAAAAFPKLARKEFADVTLRADANLALA